MLRFGAPHLETSSVVVNHHWHYYNSQPPVDRIEIFATKTGYRLLGLWALATVFRSREPQPMLALSHPLLLVKRIVWDVASPSSHGLILEPTSFIYEPQPFSGDEYFEGPKRYDGKYEVGFPWLELRGIKEEFMPPLTENVEAWIKRDRLDISGSPEQIASFAACCLDIGRPETIRDEFEIMLLANAGRLRGDPVPFAGQLPVAGRAGTVMPSEPRSFSSQACRSAR